MIASAVLSVFAVFIAAPAGPEDGCPSARQVTDAMVARFPVSVLPADQGLSQAKPDVLRAVLDLAGDGTVVRFSLLDAHGDTQLRRTLPATGPGRPATECLALADTLATIVERYLGFIAYESSDPAPPGAPATPAATVTSLPTAPVAVSVPRPRNVLIMLGAGWRMASAGSGEAEVRVGSQVELTLAKTRIAALLSIGATPSSVQIDGAPYVATLRRFPIRLGALLELPAGPGLLEPAAQIGIDLFALSGQPRPGDASNPFVKFGPGIDVEATVGYRLAISRSLFVRPEAAIGLSVLNYKVVVDGAENMPLFRTPRAYASFGIYTGFVFQ